MEYKVYLLGHSLVESPVGDQHNEVFSELGLPITFERAETQPVNFHDVLTDLMRDPAFLGAKIARPYKQTSMAYCQEVSQAVKATGMVNTIVKRPSGLIYGHNTEIAAFAEAVRESGTASIRSALVLGAGEGSRMALAALRELGCSRYLVGYRHPRRAPELSSQFRGIRRQISYFPLDEMARFFTWAESNGVLPAGMATGGQNGNGVDEKDVKQWGICVNATPVGAGKFNGQSLVGSARFMGCFERVVDLVPAVENTAFIGLALEAGVPAITGHRIFELQAQESRRVWLKEFRRRQNLTDSTSQPRRKPRFRRN